MRMTAAVLHEQGRPAPFAESRPFEIEEVEIEGPGPGEVMLEVMAAGLCHSDLSIVEGVRARPVPFVGGHEGAGVVREVGAGVQGLAPGDHVVMTVGGGCGCCHSCTDGRPVLCDAIAEERAAGMLPGGVRRLSRGGAPLNHYFGASSFAQYAVTAPYSLVKIDQAVPLDVAAMFGCAVVTGAGAALNAAKLRPGRTVAVIGLGGVGLSAVMTARLMGAARIIGIDL